jgi:hypothetical protein
MRSPQVRAPTNWPDELEGDIAMKIPPIVSLPEWEAARQQLLGQDHWGRGERRFSKPLCAGRCGVS